MAQEAVNHGSFKVRHNSKKESLTDRAYRELEELIVTLQLEPKAVLSETALSQDLGIGRTPIREALQRLAREGLVMILPRKGILVSEINPRKQLLLLAVRREIERLLARASATRLTDIERQQFIEIDLQPCCLDWRQEEFLYMRPSPKVTRFMGNRVERIFY